MSDVATPPSTPAVVPPPAPLPRPSVGGVLAVVGLFLFAVREILAPFAIAAAIAYIVFPAVAALERRLRAPRLLVVLACYLVLVGVLVGIGYLTLPRLFAEIRALRTAGPEIVATVIQQTTGGDRIDLGIASFSAGEIAARITSEVNARVAAPADLVRFASFALHELLRLLIFFVALFYLLLDGPAVVRFPLRFMPRRRAAAEHLLARVNAAWGRYVRGQLLLIVIMSTVSWLVLAFVFGLPYAFAIGIATGILEVIPLLGPLLAGALACSVALAHGGVEPAIWVAVAYFVLRQVEDQVVMPLVVGRAVHLAPIVTLFAVLSGERIAGPLGMILAIPVAAAAKVLLDIWESSGRNPVAAVDAPAATAGAAPRER